MNIGEDGFYAGETNTLNPNEDFETPNQGAVEYYPDNEYSNVLENEGVQFEDYQDIDTDVDDIDSFSTDN